MNNRYYLGIDIGSSSIKGALADHRGRVCFSGQYPYTLDQPQPGWAEIHPEVWWRGTVRLLQKALHTCPEAGEGLRGIFISGMVPNLVPLERDGQPVRPAILYRDSRALQECQTLRQRTGLPFQMQDVIPKWAWIRDKEPEGFARVHSILTTHSYVVYRLTGVLSMDSDTARLLGPGVFSPDTGWNRPLLEALELPVSALPPPRLPGQTVGTVRKELAEEWGLTGAVPVFAGIGDSLSALLGTGAVRKGDAMIYLGTAATLWFLEEDLPGLDRETIFGSGTLHFVGNTLTGGELLRWFHRNLQLQGSGPSYGVLEHQAQRVSAGSDGILVLPHFLGTHTPSPRPDAWGAVFGLTPRHTGVHLYRALMESVAYHLRDSWEASGREASRLLVTGGGAKSALWRQILTDVFQAEVQYCPGGDPALGNAYLAGVASGDFAGYDRLQAWLGTVTAHSPDPQQATVYEECFARYRTLDRGMGEHYGLLR